jgi:hypothetical protein
MAKLLLDMSAMQKDFFEDAAMIGIGTAMPAYHLCWQLNRRFEMNFIRDPEQNVVLQKKDIKYYFPVYQYDFPNSAYKHLLYKLKSGNESLLPETKLLDYLWLIQTANPEEDAAIITPGLKDLPGVQLAQLIVPGQLKNLNNLFV